VCVRVVVVSFWKVFYFILSSLPRFVFACMKSIEITRITCLYKTCVSVCVCSYIIINSNDNLSIYHTVYIIRQTQTGCTRSNDDRWLTPPLTPPAQHPDDDVPRPFCSIPARPIARIPPHRLFTTIIITTHVCTRAHPDKLKNIIFISRCIRAYAVY